MLEVPKHESLNALRDDIHYRCQSKIIDIPILTRSSKAGKQNIKQVILNRHLNFIGRTVAANEVFWIIDEDNTPKGQKLLGKVLFMRSIPESEEEMNQTNLDGSTTELIS